MSLVCAYAHSEVISEENLLKMLRYHEHTHTHKKHIHQ